MLLQKKICDCRSQKKVAAGGNMWLQKPILDYRSQDATAGAMMWLQEQRCGCGSQNMDVGKLFKVTSPTCTSPHLKNFLEPAVPPIRLFLMINMMPLKRCVVKGNYFIALLRNEAKKQIFDVRGPDSPYLNSGRCHLLPLDGAVYIFYSNLVMSNFPDKVGSN